MRDLLHEAALQDAAWMLGDYIREALGCWERHEMALRMLYRTVCAEEEEVLEVFMYKVRGIQDMSNQATKLLFDGLTLEAQSEEFSVVVKEMQNKLTISREYSDISFKESKDGSTFPIIAIIYFDGELNQLIYGEDPVKMRASIDALYHDIYERGPDRVVIARRSY